MEVERDAEYFDYLAGLSKFASASRFVDFVIYLCTNQTPGKIQGRGRSPLLGRFKGDCQGGESKLPLDYAFFRPSTALSFSYEKESGVETVPFLPRQKRYGPRSGSDGATNCTAPPAHSNCTSGGIPRHPAQKNSPFPGLLLRAKLSTCGCGLFTNLLFTTAQQMFHKIACGQI